MNSDLNLWALIVLFSVIGLLQLRNLMARSEKLTKAAAISRMSVGSWRFSNTIDQKDFILGVKNLFSPYTSRRLSKLYWSDPGHSPLFSLQPSLCASSSIPPNSSSRSFFLSCIVNQDKQLLPTSCPEWSPQQTLTPGLETQMILQCLTQMPSARPNTILNSQIRVLMHLNIDLE